MDQRIRKYNVVFAVVIFIGLPALVYGLGNFPKRSVLMEIISVSTLLAFFVMLMQFFLTRANRNVLKAHKMAKVLKWHKVLGYVFVPVLLLHPFLIILPKYIEAGIEPGEAFRILITTWSTKGIILGLIAWLVIFLLGITSLFRKRLGIKYTTWRYIHGVLSILFISVASFHVINMGRHMNTPMVWLITLLAITAIAMLFRMYFFNTNVRKESHE